MAADSVQCPHCNTLFRVNEAQLRLADGLVRCGLCTQLFNAAEGAAIPTLNEAVNPRTDTDGEAARVDASGVESSAPSSSDSSKTTAGTAQPKPRDPLELLDSLSTVDHDFEHHLPPPRRRRWPWLLASGLALIVLLGQLALWQMPQLLASPLGPEIRHYCEQWSLPCLAQTEAPPRLVAHISSDKLLVRKHPQRKDALQVDVLLTNHSDRATAFPALRLQFKDINDRPQASRVFQPREYLSGELNALSEMPSQQPIHVVLAIRDPGAKASGYELELLPSQPSFSRR